jgi:hypothetical protein
VHGNLGMVIITDQMALIANLQVCVRFPTLVVDSSCPDDARGLDHPRGGGCRQPGRTHSAPALHIGRRTRVRQRLGLVPQHHQPARDASRTALRPRSQAAVGASNESDIEKNGIILS